LQLFNEITVLLLRTLRFPEIKTCELTDELRWVITSLPSVSKENSACTLLEPLEISFCTGA